MKGYLNCPMISRHGPYMAAGWSRITTFGGGDFYRLSLEAMWLVVLGFPKEIASYIGTGGCGEKGGISWDLGGLGGIYTRGSTSIADWDFPTMNEDVSVSPIKHGWVVHCYVSVYQEGIFLVHHQKIGETHVLCNQLTWFHSQLWLEFFLFVRVG